MSLVVPDGAEHCAGQWRWCVGSVSVLMVVQS